MEIKNNNYINELPIDVVIPWVDGNDSEHYAKMLPYLEDKSIIKSKKFKTRFEHVDEIKFSVDSILKFAPFVRKIYLVTDQQTPNFITRDENGKSYDKVSIVDHSVIFARYEKYLPTF